MSQEGRLALPDSRRHSRHYLSGRQRPALCPPERVQDQPPQFAHLEQLGPLAGVPGLDGPDAVGRIE